MTVPTKVTQLAPRTGERVPYVRADLVAEFSDSLGKADDPNVAAHLGARMCCDGQMCGCQGSTVGEYLEYQLREVLK